MGDSRTEANMRGLPIVKQDDPLPQFPLTPTLDSVEEQFAFPKEDLFAFLPMK